MTLLSPANGPLLVASHNAGKIDEFRGLLAPLGFEIVSAADKGLPEPEETGSTFEENAAIKALAAAHATGLQALSDDSGLVVDALGGEPGIHSARWAGPTKDFASSMRLIQEKLQAAGAVEPERRTARFVAVLCLAQPDGSTRDFRGEVEGTLVWPPRGSSGFGYDAMFLPDGETRTFGEMSAEEKHGWTPGQEKALSHRARAFKLLAAEALSV